MSRASATIHAARAGLFCLGGLLPLTAIGAGGTAGPGAEIRLVLQVTVDGLRGDLIERYRETFGDGGFRYLLDRGVHYRNAHYRHANTETIVGHATLATGAQPADHGMTGNVWFDREAAELSYNIEDPDAPLLPVRAGTVEGEQVDPAQNLARTDGRSPRALLVPTLADTLAAYTGGQSLAFGISGKDRSAVAMAGKAGKAFWFSTDSGDFVSSRYYYDAYPGWVADWNARRLADELAGQHWFLLSDPETYRLAHQDNRPYEFDLKGFGRVFPHRYSAVDSGILYTQVTVSPAGDRLLADFARDLLDNEPLGQDDVPDYLSISFSGVDAVNHFFGPSSLENEDVVRQLDRTLAELFDDIDKRVGLEHTLIVLSADHGMADMPEYLTELGYAVGRLNRNQIVSAANGAAEALGVSNAVRFFFRPYVYINEERVADSGVSVEEVANAMGEALTAIPGVRLALPTHGLDGVPRDAVHQRIRNNQHAARSGDVYVAQDPYWFLFDEGPIPVMHGSPWRYDTHVPIVFAGPGIERAVVDREVQPADVAPTLAALLGMTAPAGSRGNILEEVTAN